MDNTQWISGQGFGRNLLVSETDIQRYMVHPVKKQIHKYTITFPINVWISVLRPPVCKACALEGVMLKRNSWSLRTPKFGHKDITTITSQHFFIHGTCHKSANFYGLSVVPTEWVPWLLLIVQKGRPVIYWPPTEVDVEAEGGEPPAPQIQNWLLKVVVGVFALSFRHIWLQIPEITLIHVSAQSFANLD